MYTQQYTHVNVYIYIDFPYGSVVQNLPASAGDLGDVSSIPGLGRSPEEGNDNPFQYPCLGNPMERDALGRVGSATGLDSTKQATVHGVAKESDMNILILLAPFSIYHHSANARNKYENINVKKSPWHKEHGNQSTFLPLSTTSSSDTDLKWTMDSSQ